MGILLLLLVLVGDLVYWGILDGSVRNFAPALLVAGLLGGAALTLLASH